MMTLKTAIPSCFGLGLLAACGGSTADAPIMLAPATFVEGGTPTAYNTGAGTLTLNGAAVTDPRNTARITNGEAQVFESGAPVHYTAIAQNGDVFAVATAADGGSNLRGFEFGRLGDAELPTTMNATYSGAYAGMFMDDGTPGDQNVFRVMDGDVALTVGFEDMTLSGSITDREILDIDGTAAPAVETLADIQISNGMIADNGTFSAMATGGERTYGSGTYIYQSGQVDGTFGGETGDAVAGVLTLQYNNPISDNPYREIGAFTGSQD
ncbi:hypothetical protein [Yoonia sp. 208BN28-4]|uniref:hypothetical protein n=1 Tax=Yoonia sp. 208BN28-4 TaxID=3126505 RepID=UPI0030B160DA